MAINTYATIIAAIGTWEARTYTTAQAEDFLAQAEAEINLILGPNYQRESTSTVATNSSGVGTIPTGTTQLRSIVRDLLGSVPLTQTSWGALRSLNPNATAGEPQFVAISGSSFKVAPVCEDNFLVTYMGTLTPLTSGATTNWLTTAAPHAYFYMCREQQALFEEQWDKASIFRAKGVEALERLMGKNDVTQFSAAEVVLDFITP